MGVHIFQGVIMKFKAKWSPLILLISLLLICFTFGLSACKETPPKQLAAPSIVLTDNIISWSEIEHADGYEVYEGAILVSAQTETSYTIIKSKIGKYKYTVKATSTDVNYTTGVASNEVTYEYTAPTQETVQLPAPVIELTGNTITWNAIEHANYYEVYEDEEFVTRVATTSYTIVKTEEGEYEYSVKAASANAAYTKSIASNTVTFKYEIAQPTDPVQLAAPVITVNKATGVISWNAVEHAVNYVVFENGTRVSTQSETSYKIAQTKVGTYTYFVVATSTSAAYTTSERSNEESYTVLPTRLEAPLIRLEGNVLIWKAVENADSYDVYESGRKVANLLPDQSGELGDDATEQTYVISPAAYGRYTYTVVAVSNSTQYASSEHSNEIVYVYGDNKTALAAPIIELDEETGVITWEAVENADGYEIYENGRRNGHFTSEPFYRITRTNPGVYTYAVRATDSQGKYKASEPSEAVSYTVVATEMTFTVGITVPEGYASTSFTIGLYNGDAEVESKELTVNSFDGNDIVTFTAMADVYVAKLTSPVASGYIATQVELTAENPFGVIRIVKVSSNNLQVGTNTFTVKNVDQEGADQSFVFIAEKGGYYTVRTSDTKAMYVLFNGIMYIDSGSGMNINSFRLASGQVVEVTVVGWTTGTYTFIIEEGAAKQDLVIGTEHNIQKDPANFIVYATESCTRYLTIEEDTTFTFFFTTATIGMRIVVLTINGVEYEFDGNENCQQQIRIEAGTDIEIAISVYGDDFEGRSIAFFVWENEY